MKTIRIGSGAGYGGDRIEPALDLIRCGNLDYIIFECLAERTIALAQQPLIALCGAKFTRFAAELPTADGTAELALDAGVLLGGGKELPLCEVEIELKTGSDAAAQALADTIAAEYGLIPERASKFRRASALAKGEKAW